MIDLHMHTVFSDGTDNIDELVKNIISSDIKVFSITDHDTINGVKFLLNNQYLLSLLKSKGIKFITGVEFSSVIEGDKIHLLGYNYDVNDYDINNAVDIGLRKRKNKYFLRLDALKNQKGIEYSQNSVIEMSKLDFIGKPIMADYLVKERLVSSKGEAYDILSSLKIPATETRVDAEIIVGSIIKSKGICVWAHPLGGINEKRISFEKVEEIINKLIPLGLGGIECYYNLYTENEIKKLVGIAKKHNLLISAGSDYHGKNKTALIGEVCNLTKVDVLDKCTILNKIF